VVGAEKLVRGSMKAVRAGFGEHIENCLLYTSRCV